MRSKRKSCHVPAIKTHVHQHVLKYLQQDTTYICTPLLPGRRELFPLLAIPCWLLPTGKQLLMHVVTDLISKLQWNFVFTDAALFFLNALLTFSVRLLVTFLSSSSATYRQRVGNQ